MAAEIRERGGTRLTTTWHVGEDGPERFSLRLGFRPTGETSGSANWHSDRARKGR